MSNSHLFLFILFSLCLAQLTDTTPVRVRRQTNAASPLDVLDSLYNQARTALMRFYNSIGNVNPGISRRSADDAETTTVFNPLEQGKLIGTALSKGFTAIPSIIGSLFGRGTQNIGQTASEGIGVGADMIRGGIKTGTDFTYDLISNKNQNLFEQGAGAFENLAANLNTVGSNTMQGVRGIAQNATEGLQKQALEVSLPILTAVAPLRNVFSSGRSLKSIGELKRDRRGLLDLIGLGSLGSGDSDSNQQRPTLGTFSSSQAGTFVTLRNLFGGGSSGSSNVFSGLMSLFG